MMSGTAGHPTIDRWLEWLGESEPLGDLSEHLRGCAGCRSLVALLRNSREARRQLPWQDPPEDALGPLLRLPRQPRLGPRGRTRHFDWDVPDIRGDASGAVAEEARIVAGSCEGGEVSVLVRPPMEGPAWAFEVRVWLRGGAPSENTPENTRKTTAVVGLVHEDHVLDRYEVEDGGMVGFQEVVGEGWDLEIHLPTGETVVLHDPFDLDDDPALSG